MRLLDRHRPHRAGDVGVHRPMHLDERPVVHLVDVVAGQDEDELRVAIGDEVEVLEDGIGGAAVPVARPAAADEGLEQRDAAAAAVEVPRPADADVVDQRARRVLGQDADVGQAGVHRVAEGEVDDPVLAAERHARLRPHLRQDAEPLTLAAGQDERQRRAGHAPILGVGASRAGGSVSRCPALWRRVRVAAAAATAAAAAAAAATAATSAAAVARAQGWARPIRSARASGPDARPARRTPTGSRARRRAG